MTHDLRGPVHLRRRRSLAQGKARRRTPLRAKGQAWRAEGEEGGEGDALLTRFAALGNGEAS